MKYLACLILLPSALNAAGPISDDFNAGSLNTSLWTTTLNGGTITQTGGVVTISVPGGSNHDAYTSGTNDSVRMQQAVSGVGDFQIEAKFNSLSSGRYNGHGLMVMTDPTHYVRFDLVSTQTGTANNVIFAAFLSATTATTFLNSSLALPNPNWLRMKRIGSTFTCYYSVDGTGWSTAISFTQAITINTMGLFASNSGDPGPANAPAGTALIDSFTVTLGGGGGVTSTRKRASVTQ